MSNKAYTEFRYVAKEDYDKELKINDETLRAYSGKKLKDLYPAEDVVISGETFEKKKRDREHDIGRIELNEKRLNVGEYGKHNPLFKKQDAFVAVEGGAFIAILKLRLLPVLLCIALLLGGIGGVLFGIFSGEAIDSDIKAVQTGIFTISGVVMKDGQPVEKATLSLQRGNEEVGKALTDRDGRYLINDVQKGNYNLVCIYEDSRLTKIATLDSQSIVVNFTFPAEDLHDVEDITGDHNQADLPDIQTTDENTDVKAMVKISDGTPAVAVGGLDTEAMLHMIVGKEVDLTFLAQQLEESKVPTDDANAITAISGELNLTYYDFSVLKEIIKDRVLESSEYLKNTKTVLEIAVPYDSSRAVGTYVFRNYDHRATRFTELSEKPADPFKDGTYFVTADTVYVYTNCFSTYAIGSVDADGVTKGSDSITYSDQATIDLKSKKIEMLYRHDQDSTNDVRIELYIVGERGNLLVAESGKIPVGYQLTEMALRSGIENMPSVGTYNGLMKIIYLDTEGNTATNVDIPLSIAITQ